MATVESANSLVEDFCAAYKDRKHPYHALAEVFLTAYWQAAYGKGKTRHANDLPFTQQRMQTIARGQGSADGLIFQVCKKAQESQNPILDHNARLQELYGAINYAAGAVVYEKRAFSTMTGDEEWIRR